MGRGLCASTLVAILGCSSSPQSDAFPDPDVAGRDANPDGIPYPTDHIGGNARVAGRRGDRIPNLTFRAYVDGDHQEGLQTVSLADFYDPAQKRHKVLHVEVAATWCSICSSEIQATNMAKAAMEAKGMAYLEVIVAGPSPGVGPALADVDKWIDRHRSTVTTAIDVASRRLGAIGITGAVVPWDVLVDTRTMEILDSAGGAPVDIVDFDRQFLGWVASNPPSY